MQKGFQTVRVHSCGDGVIATPTIGEDGNWYIGNEDTKVRAEGVDGAAGPQEPQGIKGEIGSQGPQGKQGEKGEKGEQGEKGEKGEKGDQGERGLQGEQGLNGEDADTAELERLSNGLDEVNDSLEWKLWKTVVGEVEVVLPKVFREIIVDIQGNLGNNYSFFFCQCQLQDAKVMYKLGEQMGYLTNNYCRLYISKTKFNLIALYAGDPNSKGINLTNIAKISIYYK